MNFILMVRSPLFMSATFIMIIMAAFWAWSIDSSISAENGPLEAGQDVFLIFACLVHGYQCRTSGNILDKYLRSGLILFCFGILLREFDIDKIGTSPIWESVETLVRAAVVIVFLVYLVLVLKKSELFWKNMNIILTSPMMVLTLLGCITYISGWPFDKVIFSIPVDFSVFIEETLELNATLLLFLAGTTNGVTRENFSTPGY